MAAGQPNDFTIIGVAPRGFSGETVGRAIDLWIPSMMTAQAIPEAADYLTNATANWLNSSSLTGRGQTSAALSGSRSEAWRALRHFNRALSTNC